MKEMKAIAVYENYKIPELHCQLCKKIIKPKEMLYTVVIKFGYSLSSCEECANKVEIVEDVNGIY